MRTSSVVYPVALACFLEESYYEHDCIFLARNCSIKAAVQERSNKDLNQGSRCGAVEKEGWRA